MNRRSLILIFVVSFLTPELFAQNSRLNGIWVAPILFADGARFLTLTFNVTGDTFTGTMSNTDRPGERFTDGKIENGHVSFSFPTEEMAGVTLEKSYSGTLRDDKHLDLVQETHTTGIKVTRKPGVKALPNPLEGEWGDDTQRTIFHVQGDILNGEIIDRFFLRQDGEVLADVLEHHPFTEGTVHGNEFSYRIKDKNNNMVACTGTIAGDHLVMTLTRKSPLHAVRIADAQK